MRLAFIVSHPIQYYVPVYRELAERIRQEDGRLRGQETKRLKDQEPESVGKWERMNVGKWERGQSGAETKSLKDEETECGKVQKYEGVKVEDGEDEELKRLRDEDNKDGESLKHADDRGLTPDGSARLSAVKVFYTWRDADVYLDRGFGETFQWDIPLMEGYDFEVVPNTSRDPGTHHRMGLINPELVERVKSWNPDAVHITGYNYVSHGQAIKELSKAGIPVIFRGDSHLLDGKGSWWKGIIKKSWLSKVYGWPQGFAYVGQANRDYYRAFGVPERKLFHVPHTIDVARFVEPNEELEEKALAWRRELGVPDENFVFLYAAKLEPRKRPMELLDAFLRADIPKTTLLLVGSGELERELKERGEPDQKTKSLKGKKPGTRDQKTKRPKDEETKTEDNDRSQSSVVSSQQKKTECCKLNTEKSAHRVVFLPFQNQSVMPVVYRMGDALVLPSGYGETWGLAVNEAQACGRPALVSDCVGCATDIVCEGENGSIFRTDDWGDCVAKMKRMAVAWSKETKGPKDQGTKGLRDEELKRPKDEEAKSPSQAKTAQVPPSRDESKPKDEEPSVASKREAIRAAAWEFDTARGVDALLAVLGKVEGERGEETRDEGSGKVAAPRWTGGKVGRREPERSEDSVRRSRGQTKRRRDSRRSQT